MPTYNLNTRPVGRLPRSKRLQQLGMGTASSSSSVNISITETQGGDTQTYTVATRDTSGLMSGAMVTQLDFLYNNTWTWAEVLACMDGADDPTQTVLVRTIGICERAFALTMHHRRDIILTDIFPDDARFPVDDTAKIATLEMYVTAGIGTFPATLIQRVTTPHIINADGTMNGYVQAHASIYERAYNITSVGSLDGRFGWSAWAKVEEGGGGGGTTVDAYTKAESDARYQPIGDYLNSTTAAATFQPIGDYATHADIPSLEGYATETYVENRIEQSGFSSFFRITGNNLASVPRVITSVPTGSQAGPIHLCTQNGRLYMEVYHTSAAGYKTIDGFLDKWAASLDTLNAMAHTDYYQNGVCITEADRIYKFRGGLFQILLESTYIDTDNFATTDYVDEAIAAAGGLGTPRVINSGDTDQATAADSVILIASGDTAEFTVLLPASGMKHGQKLLILSAMNSLYIATTDGTPILRNTGGASTGITGSALTLTFIKKDAIQMWLAQ